MNDNTVNYIASECSHLAEEQYMKRHDTCTSSQLETEQKTPRQQNLHKHDPRGLVENVGPEPRS